MLAVPLFLLFGGITIWGFFEPWVAGWTFVSLAALFVLWLLSASWGLRPKLLAPETPPFFFSAEEIDIFKKYSFYFRYPFQAQQYSSAFSVIQALSVIWLLLLLWHREWVLGGLIVVLFFVSTNMAPYLNPGHFLRHHNARGNLPDQLQERLTVVEAVEAKLSGGSK